MLNDGRECEMVKRWLQERILMWGKACGLIKKRFHTPPSLVPL